MGSALTTASASAAIVIDRSKASDCQWSRECREDIPARLSLAQRRDEDACASPCEAQWNNLMDHHQRNAARGDGAT
jgi:hypothetical protein